MMKNKEKFVYGETMRAMRNAGKKHLAAFGSEMSRNAADLLAIYAESVTPELYGIPLERARAMLPDAVKKIMPLVIEAGIAFLNAQFIAESEANRPV